MASPPQGPSGAAPRIDNYLLEKRIATGGMAEIFLATDQRTGRHVALKRILPHVSSDQDFLNRFFHEIRIQISLKHRNVVELLDCSPNITNAYIVMEYIDGGSLQGLIDGSGAFPWEIALYCCEEALRGLGTAHKKGIVHRDVKPQNIMWTRAGGVKIADFGISQAEHLTRLTTTGMVVGTPSFMSPEQARGETLDSRSDIFSIGTVLYVLLTGMNPFTADSVAVTLRRIVDFEPEPPALGNPTLPLAVDSVLRKIWRKDRGQRFATAEEALEALRDVRLKEGSDNTPEEFRRFSADPAGYVSTLNRKRMEKSAQKAEEMLSDSSASPEEALWFAFQSVSVAPSDQKAMTLFRTAAQRAGQREKPVENPRIRELEEQVRRDPDNVNLLLQLAKLYRLERDILGVMKLYYRLKHLAPADVYTQNQIAGLVTSQQRPAAVAATSMSKTAAVAPRTVAATPALVAVRPGAGEEEDGSGKGVWIVAALVVVLIGIGFWWVKGPARQLTQSGPLPEGLVSSLKATPVPGFTPVPGGRFNTAEIRTQKVLEKGALVEKESGMARALAFYQEAMAKAEFPAEKTIILLTISETAVKAGDLQLALRSAEEIIRTDPDNRTRAVIIKADILERTGEGAAARRIHEEMSKSADPAAYSWATLKLAMAADHGGDSMRSLTLYEELIARTPDRPEANAARLGAAALYRAAGRKGDARRLYEDVKRRSTPGSDFEKSAEAGLKTVE
ncbi:MAG: protein kinase [Thermoanaerobaculia bacterium]|nr:protein kinase [Thermoanaerobaculia bacterium]